VDAVFDGLDAVVTPTVPITAPSIEGPVDAALILRNTWPFNAARTPVISLACGTDRHGLPVGFQIAGRRGADERVLDVARFWERDP
jgi:aspartyl-tRNA(Asn)/glutamyl-tRNA(Gln) amidotransferase subunit A